MNYKERAQKIANDYALGVCQHEKPDLVKMIHDGLKEVAKEARKEGRQREKEKYENLTS